MTTLKLKFPRMRGGDGKTCQTLMTGPEYLCWDIDGIYGSKCDLSCHKACIAMDINGQCVGVKDVVIRREIEDVALLINTKGGVGYGADCIVHIDTRGRKSRWKY